MALKKISIKKAAPDVLTPEYQTEFSSGMDVHAYIKNPVTVAPGEITLIPTGLFIAVPAGYEAQVRPRSGLAIKHGITITNSPGTIDSDYRGEIKIILGNTGKKAFEILQGMRIAQLVIAPVEQPRLEVVDELPPTTRGEGGFGHSGF